jgi:NlpE N-terminal domain
MYGPPAVRAGGWWSKLRSSMICLGRRRYLVVFAAAIGLRLAMECAHAQGVRASSAGSPESLQSSMVKGGAPGAAQVASESYLGMLACGDCAGIRVELVLYQESGASGGDHVTSAAYHLRETFLGQIDGDQVVDHFGVWRESADAKRWGTILDLRDVRRGDDTFLTSAHDNEGTLIVLDSEFRELPPDVPHTLTRVTGNRQRNIAFLSEADDGRTVDLRPGEVFLLRLKGNAKTGAMWTSDRPEAMALMESDNSGPPRDPFADAVQTTAPSDIQPATSVIHHARSVASPARFQRGEIYQVWQMIAPQSGLQELRFELHRPDKSFPWPEKVVTISILVR